MIGHVIEQEEGRRLILLKAGSAYLSREIVEHPILSNGCIEAILTPGDNMYLGSNLFFGPIAMTETITIAEDPDNLTLALLADIEIARFFMVIIRKWSTGDAPSWAIDSTEDILNYMRWFTGEVEYLSRSTPTPH